ncbi:MAG TPA: HAD hydrolase family protein [Chloroflexota bacterium]|nr:HAD hydrolase family protein [Chloroflexota bacterium]
MRFVALACDYDGTLATDGRVGEPVIAALEAVRASGRRLALVTGRELDDLQRVFPRVDLFDQVVAENGALLYAPATREVRPLAEPPPPEFVAALRARGVHPLSVGRTIVATWEPHEQTVLDVIRDLGLELQVIFNKGAVMVLPSGVNKSSGFQAALAELKLSAHNALGIGDAENDHAFLSLCVCAVAVANALPTVKERADYVTSGDHGAGVVELIERLLADDLRGLEPYLTRHHLVLGTRADGSELRLPPYGPTVLSAGPPGSGKSTAATGLVERLAEQGYQFCLLDPEGDYEVFAGAIVLGDSERPPSVEEIMQLLADPAQNVVANLLGVRLEDRPAFFAGLLPHLQELRATTGRPHWLVVDEAHHFLPASWDAAKLVLPQRLDNTVLITLEPSHLAAAVLAEVDVVLAVGAAPSATLRDFARARGLPPPPAGPNTLPPGEVLVWQPEVEAAPVQVCVEPPRSERRRHRRKYAQGELLAEESFYFRGPEGKLNLRAQNLVIFLQLAEGVDDATWLYHLRRGDYSRWFRACIKDEGLADEAAAVEQDANLSAAESRAAVRHAIEHRYTLPA